MLFDPEKTHRLFLIAIKKSNDLKRLFSSFLTKDGFLILVMVYPDKAYQREDPFIIISVGKKGNRFNLEENYHLYPDGRCGLKVFVKVKSSTGWAIHSLNKYEEWEPGETLKREWLSRQLETISCWLENETTARVNPYNPNQILTKEEEDVDQVLAQAITGIESFIKALSLRRSGLIRKEVG